MNSTFWGFGVFFPVSSYCCSASGRVGRAGGLWWKELQEEGGEGMLRPRIWALGAVAPLCFPAALPAVQHPSRDDVLFPGDRAGHQCSLHLFIFLNITYFERMINNKESEIRMGTLSVLFFGGRGVSGGDWGGGLPWQGNTEGRGAQPGYSRLQGTSSALASTQGCSPGDKRAGGGGPKSQPKKDPGVGHHPSPIQLSPQEGVNPHA